MNMDIKIKLFEGGKMPVKTTEGAAAYDCYARTCECYDIRELRPNGDLPDEAYESDDFTHQKCYLGFAIELPKGYCAKIIPRSSVVKTNLRLANSVGLIDSDYRGEVSAVFDILEEGDGIYNTNDRVCQMLIEKVEPTTLVEVEELSDTERGNGGYGSTGR